MKLVTCPDGHKINGTLETIYGVAETDAVWREPDGSIAYEHGGYTDVDWNSETTVERNGKSVLVCEGGDEFTTDELIDSDVDLDDEEDEE